MKKCRAGACMHSGEDGRSLDTLNVVRQHRRRRRLRPSIFSIWRPRSPCAWWPGDVMSNAGQPTMSRRARPAGGGAQQAPITGRWCAGWNLPCIARQPDDEGGRRGCDWRGIGGARRGDWKVIGGGGRANRSRNYSTCALPRAEAGQTERASTGRA